MTDESQLRHQLQNRDPKALEHLLHAYEHKLLHLATRFTRNSQEAEDIVQESMIKAWKGSAHFRGDASIYSWLYQITLNTARSHYTGYQEVTWLPLESETAEEDDAFLCAQSSVESHLESDLQAQRISKALQAMPSHLSEVLVMRDMQGHRYEDIADILDVPLNTVKTRLHRARRMMIDTIEHWEKQANL